MLEIDPLKRLPAEEALSILLSGKISDSSEVQVEFKYLISKKTCIPIIKNKS